MNYLWSGQEVYYPLSLFFSKDTVEHQIKSGKVAAIGEGLRLKALVHFYLEHVPEYMARGVTGWQGDRVN